MRVVRRKPLERDESAEPLEPSVVLLGVVLALLLIAAIVRML
jgi:hypothetical protein